MPCLTKSEMYRKNKYPGIDIFKQFSFMWAEFTLQRIAGTAFLIPWPLKFHTPIMYEDSSSKSLGVACSFASRDLEAKSSKKLPKKLGGEVVTFFVRMLFSWGLYLTTAIEVIFPGNVTRKWMKNAYLTMLCMNLCEYHVPGVPGTHVIHPEILFILMIKQISLHIYNKKVGLISVKTNINVIACMSYLH